MRSPLDAIASNYENCRVIRTANVHPGGVKTNIVKNARFRSDHRGQWNDLDQAAKEFELMAQTTPEKAAKIIHTGVEAGKARILVGADATVFDLLGRFAPTRYYDVLDGAQRVAGPLLSKRAGKS